MIRKLTDAEIRDQRRGGTRVAAGIWLDRAGRIHVSIPELLELFDLANTPENRAAVDTIVDAHLSAYGAIVIRQEPAAGRCSVTKK
jgi:hypothetical protein